MDAEKEDPFASIIKFCRPTASQEAKFLNSPLARESENFADSYPHKLSSSPDPTPAEPTGIVMVSLPSSPSSPHRHLEDDAVFHTPPEYHARSHLSSEDENLNEIDAVDGPDNRKKGRVSVDGPDDEPEAKRVRTVEAKFDGNTVPVDETELIEVDGSDVALDAKVVVLPNTHSDDGMATVNLGDDSLDRTRECGVELGTTVVVRRIDELVKGSIPNHDSGNGNHELGNRCKSLEVARVNKGKMSDENSNLSGCLDSGKIGEDIFQLKCSVSNRCIKMRQKVGASGSESVIKITKVANMPKDCYQNGGQERDYRRIEQAGLKTGGKRREETELETDGKRSAEIGPENDGQRIQEIGLETDGKRIEEKNDGKNGDKIVLRTDDDRIEEISRKTSGKRIAEIGLISDAKKSEENVETGSKRIEEISLKTNGKRIEEIEAFRYTSDDDGRWRGREGRAVRGSCKRRQLPASLKEKEKDAVESTVTKSGLLDLLGALKAIFGDNNGDCEDVDFLETAKRRGLTFPRPRWWPSGDDDERPVF